jgi:thiol-disulfide isomerase/thioredoxin
MTSNIVCCRERAVLLLLAVVSLVPVLKAQAPAAEETNPSTRPPATQPDAEKSGQNPNPLEEETRALQKIFELSPNDPQALIKGLEDFLARFPQSARRGQILRTIYSQALQANDQRKAIETAERLLELNPEDPDLLSALTNLYDRQTDAASREKALRYAARFVAHVEKLTAQTRPAEIPAEKWMEVQTLVRATAYFTRGKVYFKSGESERAAADFQRSLAIYPTAEVAERLGDVAMQRSETDRAIDAYATAFAIPDKRIDPARREQIRRKLGSAHILKYQSEKGLGELILARYDELVSSLAARVKTETRPGAQGHDPDEFILQRLDGSDLHLSELRGKVVVMDFWATWCGPCRLEGKLFEHVFEIFRQEPAVAFLAINTDEDRSLVPHFVKEEKWTVPVAYGLGLDQLLGIRALPTVLILDREGRVIFRQAGLDPGSFVPTLEEKVREALNKD